MEPFSIHCQSCHAGLKVTKASLLGKRLPCPKCRAIVVVPKKPRPVIQDESIATSPPDDGVTSGESPRGFEDVDDLLSQLPATPPQSPKPRKKPRRNKQLESTNPPAAESIKPELSWDNPAAAKTRRILALAAAAIGIILLAAIGSYFWYSYSPAAPIDEVAVKDSNPSETVQSQPERAPTTVENTPPGPGKNEPGPSEQTDPDTNEPILPETDSPEPAPTPSTRPIVSSTPPPIDLPAPPANADSGAGTSVASAVVDPATATPDAAVGSVPAPPKARPSSDQILQPVAPATSALSELSALLKDSGSSISAITDATASVTANTTLGLPKYYFEASRSAPVDIERQLGLPCAGLRYRDVSIIEILRDVTVISGIPISVDFASLVRDGGASDKRLLPNINVDIADTDFREAIELIAQEAGWTSSVTEAGVSLTGPNASKLQQKIIDLAPIATLGDDGLDGVVDSIKVMIATDSWFSEDQPFRLERNGTSLTVHHVPSVVKQVERFIDRISAAIQLTQQTTADADRDSLTESLTPRLRRAASNIASPCELEIGSRATLGNLLNRIRQKTGVDVVTNWQTLAALEWTPQMTVPGNVSEPTLDKMLRQLERSTGATAIVLDAHTIELTHPVDALRRSYVEFYLISEFFERNFTPERAIQLVQEEIENAGQPAALTLYDPRCECIILAAPQSTHRVVEAVLQEIRQLK